MNTYRARNPRKSQLWQCTHRHFSTFLTRYPDDYQPRQRPLRPTIPQVVDKSLKCGTLDQGFARIRCDNCGLNALVADGLFTRDSQFHPLSEFPVKPLEEIFRAHVIQLLVDLDLLPHARVRLLHSWKHSGFNVHRGKSIPPENKAVLEQLA